MPGDPRLVGGSDSVAALRGLPRLDPAIPSEGLGIGGRLVSLRRLAGFADALSETLGARAVEHDDEHVIKLTEAARREYARTNDVTLLVAADRFRDRLS
ncbi:hypothetical protein [Asanoa iriomotensis]|uniref:Uncharacterized protein n=1 Tax=Asanoa iriomotensis TaxID=234613 RepID=A0ABQ4C8T8_9ACTN|nr:hypothetical protein [Asanoa iriomotensis]GIF59188.1 hypothetical protein Air01nite_52830 [Asanoa iriomotensis]